MTFKCSFFFVTEEFYAKLAKAYPHVVLLHEFEKMDLWLQANPKKRKKNYKRFIVNWLNKSKPKTINRTDVYRQANEDFERQNKEVQGQRLATPEEIAYILKPLKDKLNVNHGMNSND